VHGNRAARRILGLEAALIDHSPIEIMPLDAADARSITAEVAGPAALLIAKAHKLHDRVEDDRSHRVKDKDASDVVRLMQTTVPYTLAVVFEKLLADPVAGTPTRDGLDYLRQLFGPRGRPGVTMAMNALTIAMDPDTVEVICTSFMAQLDGALAGSPRA